MRLNIKPKSKVMIKNLDNRFHPEYDSREVERWEGTIGTIGIFTGRVDEMHMRDDDFHHYSDEDEDDNRTLDYVYEINIQVKGKFMKTSVWLFANNFEVIVIQPPKNDIEWLDRVQENFRE